MKKGGEGREGRKEGKEEGEEGKKGGKGRDGREREGGMDGWDEGMGWNRWLGLSTYVFYIWTGRKGGWDGMDGVVSS